MNTTTKQEQYAALVGKRKQCRRCDGLRNPAEVDLAEFDTDQIGPWSLLHGDLNADLMIVGQDWGDVRYYKANSGRDDLRNPTMMTLERLLRGIGLDLTLSSYGTGKQKVFLTNAILCLKEGGLQAPVRPDWFTNCGGHFLKKQIEIVAPRIVVGLGQKAYDTVLRAFGITVGPFRQAVDDAAGTTLPNKSRLLAVYHCGNRILNTHRPFEQQQKDRLRVAKVLGLHQAANPIVASDQSQAGALTS